MVAGYEAIILHIRCNCSSVHLPLLPSSPPRAAYVTSPEDLPIGRVTVGVPGAADDFIGSIIPSSRSVRIMSLVMVLGFMIFVANLYPLAK